MLETNLESAIRKLKAALGADAVILGDNEVAALVLFAEEALSLQEEAKQAGAEEMAKIITADNAYRASFGTVKQYMQLWTTKTGRRV